MLRHDLLEILKTPAGKRFFKQFLRDCNVTRPVFHASNEKLREYEGRRRLAMTYLTLVSGDDPEQLINRIEQEGKDDADSE